MKNIGVFIRFFFSFLEVKFSIYLNRRVFVMNTAQTVPRGVCSLASYIVVIEEA